jgi:hypothetical protein
MRKRILVIKQFKKRHILLKQKQCHIQQQGYTFNFKMLCYKDNKVYKQYKENIHITKPEWYFAELIDGLPQTVHDSTSYKFSKRTLDSESEKYKRQLWGDRTLKFDWEMSPDIELMDQSLECVGDQLAESVLDFTDRRTGAHLPDVGILFELSSLENRINMLVREQDLDIQRAFQVSASELSPLHSESEIIRLHLSRYSSDDDNANSLFCSDRQFWMDVTNASSGPEFAFDLASLLMPHGILPTREDFNTILVTAQDIRSCQIGYRVSWRLMHHISTIRTTLPEYNVLNIYIKIIQDLLHYGELNRILRLLTFMRHLDLTIPHMLQEEIQSILKSNNVVRKMR